MLAITLSVSVANGGLSDARDQFTSTSLGESLLEEIAASPYADGGVDRRDWDLDQYDQFEQGPGALSDVTGQLCPSVAQGYTRRAEVIPEVVVIPDLEFTIAGRRVAVHVSSDSRGRQLDLERFVPEPTLP